MNPLLSALLHMVLLAVAGQAWGDWNKAASAYRQGSHAAAFGEWQSLARTRGVAPGTSAVTLFGGGEIVGNFDQLSRTPESLAASLAATLNMAGHPKKVAAHDALLVLSPEHHRVFRAAGWDRARILEALLAATEREGAELVRGAGGVAEGMPESAAGRRHRKFRDGGLQLVRAGGAAGLMSAMIVGWAATGERGSEPVTREVGG